MNGNTLDCVTAIRICSHHDAHVGQSEPGAELPPVEGTHVLDSGKGGDGDGSAYWEDWETVSEAPIHPFLLEERQFRGLTNVHIHMSTLYLDCCLCYLCKCEQKYHF